MSFRYPRKKTKATENDVCLEREFFSTLQYAPDTQLVLRLQDQHNRVMVRRRRAQQARIPPNLIKDKNLTPSDVPLTRLQSSVSIFRRISYSKNKKNSRFTVYFNTTTRQASPFCYRYHRYPTVEHFNRLAEQVPLSDYFDTSRPQQDQDKSNAVDIGHRVDRCGFILHGHRACIRLSG